MYKYAAIVRNNAVKLAVIQNKNDETNALHESELLVFPSTSAFPFSLTYKNLRS